MGRLGTRDWIWKTQERDEWKKIMEEVKAHKEV